MTAADLADNCRAAVAEYSNAKGWNSDSAFKSGACTGFLEGFQNLDGAEISVKDSVFTVGFVNGVTLGQIARVFVKYIADHPELEHKLAGVTLFDAMFEAKLIMLVPKTSTVAMQ